MSLRGTNSQHSLLLLPVSSEILALEKKPKLAPAANELFQKMPGHGEMASWTRTSLSLVPPAGPSHLPLPYQLNVPESPKGSSALRSTLILCSQTIPPLPVSCHSSPSLPVTEAKRGTLQSEGGSLGHRQAANLGKGLGGLFDCSQQREHHSGARISNPSITS